MEWSKIKNIMLLMLVLTNVFLLFFVATPRAQTEMNEDASRLNALSILEQRGISLDSQIVPLNINHYAQVIIPDRTVEPQLASNLLGDVSQLALGGDVYRYVSDSGSIRFHSGGEFSAQFSNDAFPILSQTEQTVAATLIKKLEMDTNLIHISELDDTTTLTYRQLWDDVPLLDYEFTLVCDQNHIVEIINGKRLYGASSQPSDPQNTVSTALMQFAAGLQSLGDICRTITSITPAYRASTDLSGTIQLTPLWCIETDTGSYQLNLITGTLARI